MWEFEMPGPQGYEEAISFSNWDIFWYTRGHPSMDTERSRRHASKLLSYPITIGNVLHQYSSLTLNNQRLTPEGNRSMAGESCCMSNASCMLTSPLYSSPFYFAPSNWCSRRSGAVDRQTTGPNIRPWRTSRIVTPPARLGAADVPFSVLNLPRPFHRTPSFTCRPKGVCCVQSKRDICNRV